MWSNGRVFVRLTKIKVVMTVDRFETNILISLYFLQKHVGA